MRGAENDEPEMSFRRGYEQGAIEVFYAVELFLDPATREVLQAWIEKDVFMWRVKASRLVPSNSRTLAGACAFQKNGPDFGVSFLLVALLVILVATALLTRHYLYEREGARNVWARHARYTDALHQAVKALGMQIFSRNGVHSVTVTGIVTPDGLDNKMVLTKLLDEHGVVISGGQGKMAGKMWRWGTMGAVSETDVITALEAFEIVIRQMGYPFEQCAAVNAALDLFARTGKK